MRADIYDMATGKPVAGTRVVVARSYDTMRGRPAAPEKAVEAASDANGRVEISRLPAGIYRLTFEAKGYATRVLGPERFGSRTVKQFTVELAKSEVLQGRVTDTDGKPLKRVQVSSSNVMAINGLGYKGPDDVRAESDGDGGFALAGLPVGYAQLRAEVAGYHLTDPFAIHGVPATNVLLRLGSTGAIRGSVTDKEGHALSRYEGHEVLVEVEPRGGSKAGSWGGSARVNDNGTFEFNHVPPGEYRVKSHPNPSNSNRSQPTFRARHFKTRSAVSVATVRRARACLFWGY